MHISGRPTGSHAEALVSILPDAVRRQRVRLLVVEEGGDTAALLKRAVGDVEVVHASSADAARALLAESDVALILCNPDVAGDAQRRFFQQLADHAGRTGAGLVALGSGSADLTEAELYAMGAEACVAGPSDATVAALVRSKLARIARLRQRMLQDPVTALPNVTVFSEAFQRASYLAAREHEPLVMAVLHLGSVREVRRVTGTREADDALRQLGVGVVDTLRKSDMVARGSGDSFLILLPATNAAGARRVVEKLYHRISRITASAAVPAGIDPSLSAGVVEVESKMVFDDVLEAALAAMEPVRTDEERACSDAPQLVDEVEYRIVLAEDDELTASIIRHRFERSGWRVTHAPDGQALLDMAPTAAPSLLVLDVKMPYVDGFEALRRLRSIRSLRDVPVMMLTSMGQEEDIAHGFDLGADDYLVKPFSPIELQARAKRLLGRRVA